MGPFLILIHTIYIAGGMVMLYFGGAGLVKGAGGIALNLKIPPLVVGLTVVAFGTSAPELFVSVLSAAQGKMGVSVGNVLGSNVINVALILGISAVAHPATVDRNVTRIDAPFMLITYALVALAMANFGVELWWLGGTIARWEGAVLIVVLVGYVVALYRRGISSDGDTVLLVDDLPSDTDSARPLWLDVVFVVVGIGFLAAGAELLVRGASRIATDLFGASERFVGITVVAFGTSLPELFTTVVSIRRGEMDISVGNIVGSNIFNSLMVLGMTAAILPIGIGSTDFRTDFAFMVATTLLLILFLVTMRRVPRSGGVLFLTIYVAYLVFLMATRTV